MRILIATDCFLPRWDGIASFLNEFIPRMQDRHEITVIAPDFGELKANYKAKIIRFKPLPFRIGDYHIAPADLKVMAREIKKTDIVFTQSLGFIGGFAILLGKAHKKPVIRYNHTIEWELFPNALSAEMLKLPVNALTKMMCKSIYKKCSTIIFPSAEQADLMSIMKVKTNQSIVHLGVDVQQYSPGDKIDAKRELSIEKDKFVIGYAGRLGMEKDLFTLYRAFMMFAKKHKEAFLLIAGGGHPGLEKLFSGRRNIMLTGSKDGLSRYYKAMDIYILPSLTETTSLTTMEAMSTGIPVIVTPVGYIREYINDGINGFLFPKKNTYALFKQMENLKHHPALAESIGKKARQTIVENYSWEKTIEGIEKVFSGHVSP
jgi:glycosyltransferase involved in cell wall biosynthesis